MAEVRGGGGGGGGFRGRRVYTKLTYPNPRPRFSVVGLGRVEPSRKSWLWTFFVNDGHGTSWDNMCVFMLLCRCLHSKSWHCSSEKGGGAYP